MPSVLTLWDTACRLPRGDRLFSYAFARKATSDITCVAETDPAHWSREALPEQGADVPVRVRGVRRDGTVVVEGEIRLWVTPRRTPQAA